MQDEESGLVELSSAIISAARHVAEPIQRELSTVHRRELEKNWLIVAYEALSFYIVLATRLAQPWGAPTAQTVSKAVGRLLRPRIAERFFSRNPPDVQRELLESFLAGHQATELVYAQCSRLFPEEPHCEPESVVGCFAVKLLDSVEEQARKKKLLGTVLASIRSEGGAPRILGLVKRACEAIAPQPDVQARRQALAGLAAEAQASGRGTSVLAWWREMATAGLLLGVRTRGWQVGLDKHWVGVSEPNTTCSRLNEALSHCASVPLTDEARAKLNALCGVGEVGDAIAEIARLLSQGVLQFESLSPAAVQHYSVRLIACIETVAAEFELIGIRRDRMTLPESGEPDLPMTAFMIGQPAMPRPGQEVGAALQHCAHLALHHLQLKN